MSRLCFAHARNRALLRGLVLGLSCLLACASQKPAPQLPAQPVPPHDGWAWLPEDGSFVGKVELADFRSTPLWSVWEAAQKDPAAQASLIDASKIERVLFAGNDKGDRTASFVASVGGPFGAGSVAAAAAARNLLPEPHGLLVFYRTDQLAFAQVYPDLILACSLDRIDALAARATQGDAVKLHDAALFRSLSARLRLASADVALIAEDPGGELKASAQRQARRFGLALSAADLVRGGFSLALGPSNELTAVVETTGPAQAEALTTSAASTLDGLGNNLFVGLLGLRPLVTALRASQDQSYVTVGGSLAQADLNRALDRLAGMLGVTLAQGQAPAAAP